MSETMTFLDACLRGLAKTSEVDDWIDHWHDTAGAPGGVLIDLEDYLGLSPDEYDLWLKDITVLPDLVVKRAYRYHAHTVRYLPGSAEARGAPVPTPNALSHS